MKQKLLNKFWLRVGMIVAVMTTALSGTAWAEEVTDVLNQTFTGVTGTSYTAWSGKTATSDAVYAGQSAGGNSSIQLRTTNNNSGVVTTASGGKVKSITVVWNSNTASGRTLNVYGKNSAYSSASDLYDSSKQGTLLGTIVYGTSTQLTVTDDYEYIGFRSASSAMYLTSVSIVWEVGGTPTPSLSVSPTSIAFGEKAINTTNTETFNVTFANLTQDLTVSGFTGVTVSPTTISKTATSPATVTVTYAPTAEGSINGNITVSNTADDVSQTVAVTGSAYDPANVSTYDLFTGTLEEGDYIIYYNGVAMKSIISSNRLGYAEVTATNDVISTNDASIVWHIAKSGNYWTIYNAGEGKYAASTDSKNQGTLVDDISDNAKWTVTGSSTYDFENLARSTADSDSGNKWLRYNSGYGFACYASSTGGALSLYKLNDGTPSISANDVNIDYNATRGNISYTITNPVAGTSLTASTTANWISNFVVGENAVTFTTTANEATEIGRAHV